MTGHRVCHHRHIAFLPVMEEAPLLTKTVKINQSEGIPGSGIPEAPFVKILTNISTPLCPVSLYFSSISLFHIDRFHITSIFLLSECLEQAKATMTWATNCFMGLRNLIWAGCLGGLPFERGRDASTADIVLLRGVNFWILVSLRVFWAKRRYV